jgi:hypothetical protein
LDAVVEPGVRDDRVAEARSEFAAVGLGAFDVFDQPLVRGITLQPPAREPSVEPRPPRSRRRTQRFTISKILGRVWIPLLIAVVIGAGGLTVSRLHGIFGAENRPVYADSQIVDPAPFDPKHLTYEIFGPPGTVARISYFDANADPKRVEAAHLPWSLTFAMTDATAVGSVVAQGDSDAIGCRIVVDGVVKAEKITHETSAFTFCALKSS